MRLVFCGTPEFAVPTLTRLIAEPGITVEAVVTQPDRPRGRGQEMASSAVKEAALAAGIHVYQPEKIKSDSAFEFFKRVQPDAVAIVAYGQIVPLRLIEIPRMGWVNLHASLLPAYRGAAPANWAIANGETRTGVTTMQIDAGMDTGPILLHQEMEIGPDETAPELLARMAEAGAPLMVQTLWGLERGDIRARPQDGSRASVAPLLKKEDGRIDWSWDAQKIYNRMRGFTPWPGAFTTFRGLTCHVWGRPAKGAPGRMAEPGAIVAAGGELFVGCGEGSWLRVEAVQLEGRKRVGASEFVNGARLRGGERWGEGEVIRKPDNA